MLTTSPVLVSHHMEQQEEDDQQQPFQGNYDVSRKKEHEISISQLPELPHLRTAINEDSHEDSIHNTYLPASVPLSNKKNKDKDKQL